MSGYTIFDLYRNAALPIQGTADGAAFAWPGNACTASTFKLYPELLKGQALLFARWVCAWNPNTGSSPTAVRLVAADDGPANIRELARFTRTNYNTPVDDTIDITRPLQAVWNACQSLNIGKQIGHQTAGNGGNGPLIYGSWVELLVG